MDEDEGLVYYIMNWFVVRMPFVILIFLIIVFFTSSQLSIPDNTFDVEADIYTTRILSSPNGIINKDRQTQRPYPGEIELSRFDDININNIFDTSEKQIAGKATLNWLNKTETIHINKKYYTLWSPYSAFDEYKSYIKWFYVIVKDGEKKTPGTLRIEMVRPSE